MFCCSKKKEKIITQFYKQSMDALLKQLIYYLNDLNNLNGNICSNYTDNNYDYFIYEDNNKFIKLTVKCKLIQNKFNYKMSIYEIIYNF